jgi:hypothetical protein
MVAVDEKVIGLKTWIMDNFDLHISCVYCWNSALTVELMTEIMLDERKIVPMMMETIGG